MLVYMCVCWCECVFENREYEPFGAYVNVYVSMYVHVVSCAGTSMLTELQTSTHNTQINTHNTTTVFNLSHGMRDTPAWISSGVDKMGASSEDGCIARRSYFV